MDNYFHGLRCGDIFATTFRDELGIVGANPKPTSVWFGPRMQWGYPAFGYVPPIGEPTAWIPGIVFAESDREKLFNNFLNRRSKILIFPKNDFLFLQHQRSQQNAEILRRGQFGGKTDGVETKGGC